MYNVYIHNSQIDKIMQLKNHYYITQNHFSFKGRQTAAQVDRNRHKQLQKGEGNPQKDKKYPLISVFVGNQRVLPALATID